MSNITLDGELNIGVSKRVRDLGFGPMTFTGRIAGNEGLWFLSHVGVTRILPNKSDDGGTGWEMSYINEHIPDLEVENFQEVNITIKVG